MSSFVVDLVFQGVTAVVAFSFEDFSVYSWIFFSVTILLCYNIFSKFCESSIVWRKSSASSFLSSLFPFSFDPIPVVKLVKDEDLSYADHFHTLVNRAVTTPLYISHLVSYLRTSSTIRFSVYSSLRHPFTFILHFLALFAIYDFIYYFFHRTLHIPQVYGWIHKHHHAQVSPFRGTYDGINTHVFEFLFGIYLHLWSLQLLCFVSPACQDGLAFGFFLVLTSFFASLNHTRHAIFIPNFYDVRDHDVHHRMPQSNFGQYVMWWDVLFGSFHPFHDSKRRRQREEQIAATLREKEDNIVKSLKSAKMGGNVTNGATEGIVGTKTVNFADMDLVPNVAVVTGGHGMVGAALSKKLVDLGCERVYCIDIAPPDAALREARYYAERVEWCNVDITDRNRLVRMFDIIYDRNERVDAVYHTAALVGPYYKHELYYRVNYEGTLNMLDMCRKYGIGVFVDVSSPSTKYNGRDIEGLDEEDFVHMYEGTQFIHEYRGGRYATHEYARTKSLAEKVVFDANNTVLTGPDGATAPTRGTCATRVESVGTAGECVDTSAGRGDTQEKRLYTCIIAPHQIYGPQDKLFLPTVLATGTKTRIPGSGDYYVSFCHVENLCHAMILATRSLMSADTGGENGMPVAAGKLYFVTDDDAYNFWDRIDEALMLLQKLRLEAKGMKGGKEMEGKVVSLWDKYHVPRWFLLFISYFGLLYSKLTGNIIRLIPFSIRMTTINRYFCIGKIKRELGYKPIKPFEEAWSEVVQSLVRKKVETELHG